jgi:hypothetical protein
MFSDCCKYGGIADGGGGGGGGGDPTLDCKLEG